MRPPRPARRPSDLEHLERRVRLATTNAHDAHLLRRQLRQLAGYRLASGHGIDLDSQPDAARAVLGAELWALVGPGLDRPPDRDAPGRAEPGSATRRHRAAGAHVTSAMLDIGEVASRAGRILDEVERAVVGKRQALELVLLGLLADGHVLIEDYPGLAKTVIARCFAHVMGLGFARIQFTPDLMPADVTGASIYDQRSGSFDFRPGPVFTNLLLADEINRTPPKTQAALLEAMQERQVTVEGTTRPLQRPFLVVATQNPIEYEGTYPLPEAQLDRFLLRVRVGYPDRDDEWRILAGRLERASDDFTLQPVTDATGLLALQAALEQVHVAEAVGYYMVDLAVATRADPNLEVGASPRGALALLKLARAKAVLAGRDWVTPDDVKHVAVPALAHRLTLRPELWVRRVDPEQIVADLLQRVPTPAAEDLSRPS